MGFNWILGELVRGANITEWEDTPTGRQVTFDNGRVFHSGLNGQRLVKEAPGGNPHAAEEAEWEERYGQQLA